ncbi:Putative arsenite methyltransferase [uncultured archaeon]|nr:Putative arsenite methyltransferase [uncultured archaeon]
MKNSGMKDSELKVLVRKEYGDIARQGGSCCPSKGSCCTSASSEAVSRKIGYSEEDLMAVPSGSNLGLGCGNPIALASIKEGEIVLDLGSGAGFDSFLASRKVGALGKVIGVDMTPEMVERARLNAARGDYSNVEFRLGELERLPVADSSVDVAISNCVINLVPDKMKVFAEAFRVLKPGGRLMVSDIVLLKNLPDFVKQSAEAYVGCLSGAVEKERYLEIIRSSGFEDVEIIEESTLSLDLLKSDPIGQALVEKVSSGKGKELEAMDAAASSIRVQARKPRR